MTTTSYVLSQEPTQDVTITASTSGYNRFTITFARAPKSGTVELLFRRPGADNFISAGAPQPATAPTYFDVQDSVEAVRIVYVGRDGGRRFMLWLSNSEPVATEATLHSLLEAFQAAFGGATDFPDAGTHTRLETILSALVGIGAIPEDFPDAASQTLLASLISIISEPLPLPAGAAQQTTLASVLSALEGLLSVQVTDGSNAATIKPFSVQIVDDDNGIATNTVIHGRTTAGGGAFVDVKVSPSGSLAADVSGSSVSVSASALPTGAATEAKVEAVRALLAGTLAVSAASLPLPAGAATEATLTAIKALLPTSIGQKALAGSLGVALASDQGVQLWAPLSSQWGRSIGPIVNTSAVNLIAAPGAGFRHYITGIQLDNVDASPASTSVTIRNVGGAALWVGTISGTQSGLTPLPPVPRDIKLGSPIAGAVGGALEVVCGTSGASVRVNVQGFAAA